MLKSSKLSHKPHKSSKDSMMRKDHVSKKILRGRSPVRSSGSSRPPPMKPISPGMKRSHPVSKRKASHSPRLRSIASSPHRSLSHHNKPESPESMDREHAMKAYKYEKRKRVSNSPMRHMAPASPHRPILQHEQHSASPYAERFQTSSSVHPAHYSPSRKKNHRSRSASPSPPRRHMVEHLHPKSHIPHRPDISPSHSRNRRDIPLGHGERGKHYNIPIKHRESPVMSSSHVKDVVAKAPFPNPNSRYRSSSPNDRYLPVSTKSYGPTLHERFSSVIDRSELSVRYSREDLEKITIDVRNSSPLPRHPVNPTKMKLVSRVHEGHRPIFDRDELKYVSKDVPGNVYYDRKATSYEVSHSVNLQGSENYQITRPRYVSHHENYPSGNRHPVHERYPAHETKKSVSLDRDEREREYNRAPASRPYVHSRSRSRSGDRDFRSDRYLDAKPSSSRPEYESRPPVTSFQSRNSVPYPHRKTNLPVDARHKLNIRKEERESHLTSVRSENKDHYFSSSRHYPEPITSSRVERRDHVPDPEPPKWDYRNRSPSREKLVDLPRRPDRYGYKPWNDKPDISVKSASYHEYGSREGSNSFRGSSRPFRSTRGFRSRGFRGPIRGSSFHRGSFRGSYHNSSSPRARGLSRR